MLVQILTKKNLQQRSFFELTLSTYVFHPDLLVENHSIIENTEPTKSLLKSEQTTSEQHHLC